MGAEDGMWTEADRARHEPGAQGGGARAGPEGGGGGVRGGRARGGVGAGRSTAERACDADPAGGGRDRVALAGGRALARPADVKAEWNRPKSAEVKLPGRRFRRSAGIRDGRLRSLVGGRGASGAAAE